MIHNQINFQCADTNSIEYICWFIYSLLIQIQNVKDSHHFHMQISLSFPIYLHMSQFLYFIVSSSVRPESTYRDTVHKWFFFTASIRRTAGETGVHRSTFACIPPSRLQRMPADGADNVSANWIYSLWKAITKLHRMKRSCRRLVLQWFLHWRTAKCSEGAGHGTLTSNKMFTLTQSREREIDGEREVEAGLGNCTMS